jgi:polyketide cyclase/dehydrase/lipid transport protein
VSLNDYRFRDLWSLSATTARVFDALVDVSNWPRWWPDVRSVHQVDDDTAELLCRAALPYGLTFNLHRAEQDATTGRLRVDMTGDLDGYCEAVVTPETTGARLAIDQRVVVHKRLLRSLAPVARPLFLANHALMMWRGQRGLRSYLTPRVQHRPDVRA